MKTMEENIGIQWQTIAVYMAAHPILNKCRQGKQKRGAVPLMGTARGPGHQLHIWVRQVMVHLGFCSCFCIGKSMPGGYRMNTILCGW
jgi:hypothetical protein